MTETLQLAHGLGFADLYDRDGLARIDALFCDHLRAADPALYARFVTARATPDDLERKDESTLLIDLGPHVEDFLAALFGVRDALNALTAEHHRLAPLYTVKRLFVQRQAAKKVKPDAAAALDGAALAAALQERMGQPLTELSFATAVQGWEAAEDQEALDLALS